MLFENDENSTITPFKAQGKAKAEEEFVPDVTEQSLTKSSHPMKLDMESFIAEVDRYQISDRAAAALATGLLKDLKLVSEKDSSNVVDRNRIRRDRKKRQNEG